MKKMTELQAFCSMVLFLDRCNKRQRSDDIETLLSGLQLLSDNSTMNPVFWDYWTDVTGSVLADGGSVKKELTDLQALNATQKFLGRFNARDYVDIKKLLSALMLLQSNEATDPLVQKDWNESVEEVLKEEERNCPSRCMFRLLLKQ